MKALTHAFSTRVVLFLHQTAPFLKIILEQSKRPRLEVGHQGVVFQHPGVNTGVPLQQLMPTVQGKPQPQRSPCSSEGVQAGPRQRRPEHARAGWQAGWRAGVVPLGRSQSGDVPRDQARALVWSCRCSVPEHPQLHSCV